MEQRITLGQLMAVTHGSTSTKVYEMKKGGKEYIDAAEYDEKAGNLVGCIYWDNDGHLVIEVEPK